MSQAIDVLEDKYERVMIQDVGNQPYIYVISFTQMNPDEFVKAERKFTQTNSWHHFYQVGKYHFMQRDEILRDYQNSPSPDRKVLMVMREMIPGATIVAEAGGFLFMH